MIFSKQQLACPCCYEYTLTSTDDRICAYCVSQLPFIEQGCVHCGLSVPREESYCAHCSKRRYAFDKLLATFEFDFPIQSMLHRFKYHDSFAFARLLHPFLLNTIQQQYAQEDYPQALLPIPLHPKKQRLRGYNQALEIAKDLSSSLAIPIKHSLMKQRLTESQSTLPLKERYRNIRGVFTIASPDKLPSHVALIDDVATSCATAHEASQQLKASGVERVDVWCVARTRARYD